jgi:hypothetical protein
MVKPSVSGRLDGNATAAILILLGVFVFGQHLVSHMGVFTVFSSGVDDFLIGYPTAGILVYLGLRRLE